MTVLLMPDSAVVTGTRYGWSARQRDTFAALATGQHPRLVIDGTTWQPVRLARVRHGRCTGVDAQAHELIRGRLPGCELFQHPQSANPGRVADLQGGIILPADPDPLNRNRTMVRLERMVIGVPASQVLGRRGGTASTVGYALRCRRLVVVIWRDGTVEPEPAGLVTKTHR